MVSYLGKWAYSDLLCPAPPYPTPLTMLHEHVRVAIRCSAMIRGKMTCNAMLYSTIGRHTTPHHTTPYRIMLCLTIPRDNIRYSAIPHSTIEHNAIPLHWAALLCTAWNRAAPYHTAAYHAMPDRTEPALQSRKMVET